MASYGDVRVWNPEWLHDTVGRLNRRCTDLVGLSDEVADASRTNRWHGDAAVAAAQNLRHIRAGLADLISEVAAMRTAMGEAADDVSALLHGVAEAESLAGRYFLRIDDDGALIDTSRLSFSSDEQHQAWEHDRDRIKAELADRIKEILRRAEDIDNDLNTVAARCLNAGGVGERRDGSFTEAARAGGDAGHLSMLEAPPGGTATANAGWFATLTDTEKNWIIANHPEMIGNLDGVPAHYRDLANRARIPIERTRLQADLDDKIAELRKDHNFVDLLPQILALEAKLDALNDIGKILDKPDRHLLVLDLTGHRPKAATAVGNVDTANHVAVFTPGMNSTVNNRMEGYDLDVKELQDNALRELRRNDRDGETVAAVTWLNYEPPATNENPQDALGAGKAEEGAARLSSFLNGIDASRADDPHLTALGHSYGSLTTGITVRDHATGVDEVAVFGSPGLGVDDTTRLQAPQGHIYNLKADDDPVAFTGTITKMMIPGTSGWHGADPGLIPGMHQLSTHEYTTPDGRHVEASHGHSEYLRADGRYSTSEWNLANIVAGTGITH